MGDSDDEYDRRGRGRDKFRRERNDYADARPPVDVGGGGPGGPGGPVGGSVGGGSLGGGLSRRNDWGDRNDPPNNSASMVGGSGGTGGGGGGGGGNSWTSSSGGLNRGGGGGVDRNLPPRRDNYGRDSYGSGGGSMGNRGYNSGGGGGYNSRNDRYSPADRTGDMSPPSKRMRGGGRDWDDRYPNYELGGGHHSGGGGGGHYGGSSGGGGGGYQHHRDEDELHQPPMLTLKQFLLDQDDNIDEETLLKKYNDYKSDFRRTQLQEFFNRHKDEEWFRVKYFPDEIAKRKERQAATNARRLAVFMKLHEDKWFDGISLDVDQADAIVRVMDAVAIMLEGGTDFDLKAIDEAAAEEAGGLPRPKDGPGSIFAVESASGSKASGVVVAPKAIDLNLAEQQQQQASSASSAKGNDSGLEEESAKSPEGEGTTATEAGAGGQEEDLAQQKSPPKASEDNGASRGAEAGELEEGEEAASVNDSNDDHLDAGELADSSDGMSFGGPKEKTASSAAAAAAEEAPKPRALHKTCSIFFRNLAPSVTRAEIEEECKKFPGFLRLSISEAQADRKFARRGWATYERTVPIREICWALNSVKIRGTELGPIVNRDLTRRIRSVNGISSHKTVVRADIRHAAKLIMKLDAEKGLWPAEGSAETTTSSSAAENTTTSTSEHTVGSNGNGGGENHSAPPPSLILSRNPLLKNIADYLIEEASAEEEELLGGRPVDGDGASAAMDTSNADGEGAVAADEEGGVANGSSANGSNSGGALGGVKLERDEALLAYLDRLLLYLRIVHSTDYYSSSEYPQEDEMPNRIGLIHARGLFSSARVAASEVSEYMREVEGRVAGLLAVAPAVTPEEAKRLGLKDLAEAEEAFIKENTKELSEGKWLCPLSNKKFMGPEFVRKHILNKHMERVEQVREEALYFNNYVLDAKRPQLPEHPSAGGGHDRGGSGRHSGGGGMMSNSGGGYSRDHRGDMHGGLSGGGHYGDRYGGGYNRHSYGNNRYSGGGGGENRYGMKRSRHYRDWDAPADEM